MYKTLLGEQGKSHVLAEFLIIFDFTVIKKSSNRVRVNKN